MKKAEEKIKKVLEKEETDEKAEEKRDCYGKGRAG